MVVLSISLKRSSLQSDRNPNSFTGLAPDHSSFFSFNVWLVFKLDAINTKLNETI